MPNFQQNYKVTGKCDPYTDHMQTTKAAYERVQMCDLTDNTSKLPLKYIHIIKGTHA